MVSITVTVSGSFHRHMAKIAEVVNEFKERGVRVLSPADPRVVDSVGPFLFVASDRHRSVRLVQDRHLAAIAQSDFLWLVAPDGYIGQSASLELGFAIAYAIPIFCETLPPDLTLRQYITQVKDVVQALEKLAQQRDQIEKKDTLLIDPISVVNAAYDKLSGIEKNYSTPQNIEDLKSSQIYTDLQELKQILFLPNLKK